MLASRSHKAHLYHDSDYIAVASAVLHAFLRADIDRDLFAERPEDAELASDEILKLEEALCECWTAAKLWHDHAATLQEGMVFTPFLTDPSRCRYCEVGR